MKIKKRQNYLLIEVLIAFSLLALASLPLAISPALYAKKEMETLRKIDFERLSLLQFAEIKMHLVEKHPFNKIAPSFKEAKKIPFSIENVEGFYHLWISQNRKKGNKEQGFYRLLSCKITFETHSFEYFIFIKQMSETVS